MNGLSDVTYSINLMDCDITSKIYGTIQDIVLFCNEGYLKEYIEYRKHGTAAMKNIRLIANFFKWV